MFLNMFQKTILLIFLLLLLQPSCTLFSGKAMMKERFKDDDIDAVVGEAQVLEIHDNHIAIEIPELEYDGSYEIPYKDIIDSIYIVPLETTSESLVGAANKVFISDDTLYILDLMKGKCLKRFSMDGRYIDQIGALGNGPGEYIEPTDVFVDDEVTILDQFQDKILVFDKKGNFKYEKHLPFIALQIGKLDSLNYLFRSSDSQNYHIDELLDYNFWTTDTSFIIKGMGLFRKKSEWIPLWNPDGMRYFDGRFYITDFFADTIWSVRPDGSFETMFVLNLGERFPKDAFRGKTNVRECNDSKDYYFFQSYLMGEDYVLIGISIGGRMKDIFFSRRTNRSICVFDMLLDSEGSKLRSILGSPATVKGNTFVCLKDCHILLDNPNFDKMKYTIGGDFSNIKPDDNPVLIFYKMKEW